jgi:hypothetical protein
LTKIKKKCCKKVEKKGYCCKSCPLTDLAKKARKKKAKKKKAKKKEKKKNTKKNKKKKKKGNK